MAKGQKYDKDKAPMDLIPGGPLLKVAQVLGQGAQKYSKHNWRGGIEYSRLIGAALRHIYAFNEGQDKDPETGISHAAHAACCMLFLLEMEERHPDLDDRFKE